MDQFARWRAEFRRRAFREGISAHVFDRQFQGLSPNNEIIAADRNQPEVNNTLSEYLQRAVSCDRIDGARRALQNNRSTWQRIEAEYKVEREIVAAIWGLESNYGAVRGDFSVVRSLATLAFEGRRRNLFESQLIAALRIIQSGDTSSEKMLGSWAGAMGHTQFMPSSYLQFAVDFDRDGKRDIWGDDPTDALASTAAFLRSFGWKQGGMWGQEVTLDRNFDRQQAGLETTLDTQAWRKLGVHPQGCGQLPELGPASVIVKAKADDRAYMVFENFNVLLRYNRATHYCLAVGLLADGISTT